MGIAWVSWLRTLELSGLGLLKNDRSYFSEEICSSPDSPTQWDVDPTFDLCASHDIEEIHLPFIALEAVSLSRTNQNIGQYNDTARVSFFDPLLEATECSDRSLRSCDV